jgi:hypothetical protein
VSASSRKFLISSVFATVMKLKKERRVVAGVCTSSCEVLAGWLIICPVAESPTSAAFGCFGCWLDFFLAI